MSKGHLQNVDFEFIRYANCWEDPYVLLDGFDIQSDSQIVSIASGGDNSFSLAAEKPERVIALDVSIVQLFLVQLKIAAIRKFNRSEYLEFAGFNPSDAREEYYKMIRDSLDKSVRAYWDLHLNEIKTGIIHIGKFEKYFQLFRDSFLLKIHDQSTIDGLFEKKSSQEQLNYYDQSWFDPRWEEMHGEFFSKEMYRNQAT